MQQKIVANIYWKKLKKSSNNEVQMKYSILEIYKGGINLVSKNIDILAILILVNLLTNILNFYAYNSIHWSLPWLHMLLLFLFFCFSTSIPLFIVEKSASHKLNLNKTFFTVLLISIRLVKPVLGLILVWILLISVVFVLFSFLSNGVSLSGQFSVINLIQVREFDFYGISPFTLYMTFIIAIFSGFSIFLPPFFSLKNYGFFKSLKHSCLLALSFIKFTLSVILVSLIEIFISIIIPSSGELIRVLTVGLFSTLVFFILGISAFYLYQKSAKN